MQCVQATLSLASVVVVLQDTVTGNDGTLSKKLYPRLRAPRVDVVSWHYHMYEIVALDEFSAIPHDMVALLETTTAGLPTL